MMISIVIRIFDKRLIRAFSFIAVLLSVTVAAPAHAGFKVEQNHALPKSKLKEKPAVSNKEPVLLTADDVEYDRPNDVVTASGHVEVIQGDTIILADTLVYDRAHDQVQAVGNVSMLEPSGNVYFADATELQNGLKSGLIHQFKARLADNSLFVANGANKVDENITELFKAAYTPCKCTDDNGKPKSPMWSIRADHATIDQLDQEVRYQNAYFNVYGAPVFYTPYMSHPAPGADNQSGLLMPELVQSRNLGTVYKQPAYYAIAPDRDITVTPILTTKEGPVLAMDYRQMFDAGPLNISGSITNANNIDALGNPAPGNEVRGNIDGRGNFKINDNYDWGFDVRRASDDTYLHLYNFGNDSLLTSRIYSEGFNFVGDSNRNYASIEGLSFQGLTGQDNAKVIPVVAPLMNFTWQSNPLEYNSRVTFEGNSMVLYRTTGDESRRLSGTARLNLPYITDDGQIIEFETQLRTDIYDVSNVQLADGRSFSGTTGREVPQGSVTWRYPFINRFDNSSLMIEPIANFIISPGGGNPEKIPNEDSLLPDFTDANLFSTDRFAGMDRIENGPRMSYGLRGQAQVYSDKYVDWLVGQQYRVINDPNFPISNDLTSNFSDYVGKVGITSAPYSLSYRFRLDKSDLAPHRSEIDAGYNQYPVTLTTSYLSLKNDPVLASREVVTANSVLNVTQEWGLVANGSRDLRLDQTVTINGGVVYKNECVNLTTMVGKDYTSLLDIKPSLTFWLRVSLKNLD